MSDSDPFGPSDQDGDSPFGEINFFVQDLIRMFAGGSSGPWDNAYQIAASVATEGQPESNVDPAGRLSIEQLTRVAELHVSEVTGLAVDSPLSIEAMNRSQWARRFLDDERPLLEGLSDSIGAAVRAQLQQFEADDDSGESMFSIPGMPGIPAEQMMHQLISMLGPMMLGVMAGGTAGQLALRAFGCYEFPLPRPQGRSIPIVLTNIDDFAGAWSLPVDGIRLWVCVSDVAHHQVLSLSHVRTHLEALLAEYVSSFTTDPAQVEEKLREIDLGDAEFGSEPELELLQNLTSNPDQLLGAIQSDTQRYLMDRISTLVAVIEGYVDWVVDSIGTRLIPEFPRITEALRRRRVEATAANRYLERLFGLELSQSTFDLGSDFITGVEVRAGATALTELWKSEESLPTYAELRAPGLWLARLGITADEMDLGDLGEIEIPDFPDLDS
ncbi:MAG: zinc-dependent metalloprotease [Microthrixaceae bacterium]|nr:zinc-dependent metalloprotease [Microthrixaceae bacterium]